MSSNTVIIIIAEIPAVLSLRFVCPSKLRVLCHSSVPPLHHTSSFISVAAGLTATHVRRVLPHEPNMLRTRALHPVNITFSVWIDTIGTRYCRCLNSDYKLIPNSLCIFPPGEKFPLIWLHCSSLIHLSALPQLCFSKWVLTAPAWRLPHLSAAIPQARLWISQGGLRGKTTT